jgi:hypothetical protein
VTVRNVGSLCQSQINMLSDRYHMEEWQRGESTYGNHYWYNTWKDEYWHQHY